MFCYKCGFEIKEQFNFCPRCGADLRMLTGVSSSDGSGGESTVSEKDQKNAATASSEADLNTKPQTVSGSEKNKDDFFGKYSAKPAPAVQIKYIKRPKFFITDPARKTSDSAAAKKEKQSTASAAALTPVDEIVLDSRNDLTEENLRLINANAVKKLVIGFNGSFINQETHTNILFSAELKKIDFKIELKENVTDISGLFFGCLNLASIAHKIDVKNITCANYLFFNCINLKGLPLINFSRIPNIKTEIKELLFHLNLRELELPTALALLELEVISSSNLHANSAYQRYLEEQKQKEYEAENPVLTSANDITADLLDRIAEDRLKSMTFKTDFFTNTEDNPFYMVRDRLTSISYSVTIDQSVTTLRNLFYGCSLLEKIPALNYGDITDFSYAFCGCSSITAVPLLNTAKAVNMASMFKDCSSMTSVPKFSTDTVENMDYMFYNCSALTSIPNFTITNVKTKKQMLTGCSSLKTTSYSNSLYDSSRGGDGKTIGFLDAIFTGLKSK